jgi:hypothetical protein
MHVIRPLVGSWVLRRSIDNGATMTGHAFIAARGNRHFDYEERVCLQLADGRMIDGERRYLFEECADGFAVSFAENPPRLFHHVALERAGPSLIGTAVHLCGADQYDSRYEFRADGSFVIEHAVLGPRKRYTISTHYSGRRE